MKKMKYFILLSILSCRLLFAQQSTIHTDIGMKFEKVVQMYKAGRFWAAQKIFQEFMLNKSNDFIYINSHYYNALCSFKLNRKNSENILKNFIEKFPTSPKVNDLKFILAKIYFSKEKYTKTIEWFEKLSLLPLTQAEKNEYYFKLGYAKLSIKKYESAKYNFGKVDENSVYKTKSNYYNAHICYEQGNYKTALVYLNKIKKESSFSRLKKIYITKIYFQNKSYNKVIKEGLEFLKSVKAIEKDVIEEDKVREEIDFLKSEVNKIIGESYFQLKKYKEAIPYLLEYEDEFQKSDYYQLGFAYYQLKKYKEAISYFNKITNGNSKLVQESYYQLAICYMKLKNKKEAMNAFRSAANMVYDKEIQKSSWLNYAKLSYEIGNIYENVSVVLSKYLKLYPDSQYKEEIYNYLLDSYIASEKYEKVIQILEKVKVHSLDEKKAYQKVTFYRGIQLYNESKYKKAQVYFQKSLKNNFNMQIKAKALYWNAESYYMQNKFRQAIRSYKKFKYMNQAKKMQEYSTVNYHLGITYVKAKNYNEGLEYLKLYLETSKNDELKYSSLDIIANVYFINKKYREAIKWYNKCLEENYRLHYSTYQKALCYGLLGNMKQKIASLKSFLVLYRNSIYGDEVVYELGNSYLTIGNNKKAIFYYKNLEKLHPRSVYIPKSKLKLGLVYYNTNQNDKSLKEYKQIVKDYPLSLETKEAIANAKKVYLSKGNVEEYVAWTKSISFMNITPAQVDSTTYQVAEKKILANKREQAIVYLQKYLQKFPKGIFQLQANLHMGQSLDILKKYKEAIPYYKEVINLPNNDYTETSLVRLIKILLVIEQGNSEIKLLLERLEKDAKDHENVLFAQKELLKMYFINSEKDKALEYAQMLEKERKLDVKTIELANLVIARHYISTNDSISKLKFRLLEKSTNTEIKVEALYHKALFVHQQKEYKKSNKIVFEIAANFAEYKYWGAKSLLLMAKNYYQLKDNYQTSFTCKSIIDNFEFENVKKQAKELLNELSEQKKQNSN